MSSCLGGEYFIDPLAALLGRFLEAVFAGFDQPQDEPARALGKPLPPGTFGENLTISDLESARLSVGDRLRLGGVLLEVTAPRLPCSTLAARMGDRDFVKRFRDAGRPGVYCRVIQEGWVQAGMPVLYEAYTGETITLLEMFQSAYENLSAETLQRQLKAPMAIRARVDKEEQLRKLGKL